MRKVAAPLALLPLALQGQEAGAPPLSLKDLLATRVVVASQLPVGTRESPGIITVLRREEIQASGARDLQDLLRLVPGFEFGSDSQGVVGVGVRTEWGHDGKVLLLIDGQEMNEPMYGTTQFGGHYALDEVDRIEIIRGPGSAQYGGYAELAVIHVFTRKGEQLQGAAGGLRLGTLAGGWGDRRAHVAYGEAHGDLQYSVAYQGGRTFRGEGAWPLPGGRTSDVAKTGWMDQDFLNVGVQKGAFSLRALRDRYRLNDFTEEFTPEAPIAFRSDLLEARYAWEFSPSLTLTPRLAWKHQEPWRYDLATTSKLSNDRTVAGMDLAWSPTPSLTFQGGVESTEDQARRRRGTLSSPGWSRLSFTNRALRLQTLWATGLGNVDFGFRVDHHSTFGTTTTPRVAYTLSRETWHVKLLAASAFRAPAIANLEVNPGLRPERTTTYELEGGWRVSPQAYLTLNLFHLRIFDPISYVNPAPGVDWYANFERTGSRGLEVDLQIRGEAGWSRHTLSLSRAEDRQADFYRVTATDRYHVGFANLKWTSAGSWRLTDRWRVNPSLIALGARFGYRNGETQASRFEPTALLNLWAAWTPRPRWEVAFGVDNLLGAEQPLIQAYGSPGQGGNPPIPGPGRTFSVRLGFNP
jgi:outer membrane cobalamin receptor